MLVKFLLWLLNRTFNGERRAEIEPCIKELYRRMAKDNLIVKSEIVKVKKGKRRYDLLYIETPSGTLKLNVGRLWDEKLPVEIPLPKTVMRDTPKPIKK